MARTEGLSDGVQGCLWISLTKDWDNLALDSDVDVVEIIHLTDNLSIPDNTDMVKSKARGFRNTAQPTISGRHHLMEEFEIEVEWDASNDALILLESARNALRLGTGEPDVYLRQTDYSNPAVGDIAIRGVFIITSWETVNNAGNPNGRKIKFARSPRELDTKPNGKVTLA